MITEKPLIVIVGPTAVGKTATSIQLAKQFQGEIISGDSMQVYRGMDIGTAKISKSEMEGVPHHLIDTLEPYESFSVADFQVSAKEKIETIYRNNHLPFIVGGTGLYVNAVIYDYHFAEVGEDPEYRAEMEKYAAAYGNIALHQKLKDTDPGSYSLLHPNNRRRVIRALEVYYLTGKPLQNVNADKYNSPYSYQVIGLTMNRDELYERINQRVDEMLRLGLIEEVRRLYDGGLASAQSMQAIGYKEIVPYIEGTCSIAEATENLKQNSRRFAKRQLTWFRNKMDIEWFDMSTDREQKLKEIIAYLEGKLF